GVVDVRLEALAKLLEQLLALLVGELRDVHLERLGPQVVLIGEVAAGLAGLEVLLAAGQRFLQLEDPLFLLAPVGIEHLVDLALQVLEIALAGLIVHGCDHRGREVEDLLELLGSHVQQVTDPAGNALEEPDVADGRGQVDVTHALAADLRARDLNAAALADDALVPDALVLAAVALPVLRGPENALAEQTVALGLERAVVDRLRLRDLTRRPVADLLTRCETDADRVELIDVDQVLFAFFLRGRRFVSLRCRRERRRRQRRRARRPRRPRQRRARCRRDPRGTRRPAVRARRPGRRGPGPPRPPGPWAGARLRGASRARGRCRALPQRGAARRPPRAPRPRRRPRRSHRRRAPATASPSGAP